MAGLTKEQRAQRAAEKAAKEAAARAQTEGAARESGAIDVETAVEGAVNQGGETQTEDRAEDGRLSVGDHIQQAHADEPDLAGRVLMAQGGEALPPTLSEETGEALNVTRIEDAPAVETIRMVRDEPIHPGGPTSADVHPDEVDNWAAADWRVE